MNDNREPVSKATKRQTERIFALKSSYEAELAKRSDEHAVALGATIGALYLSIVVGVDGDNLMWLPLSFVGLSFIFLSLVTIRKDRILKLAIDLRQYTMESHRAENEKSVLAATEKWPALPSQTVTKGLTVCNLAVIIKEIFFALA